MIVALLLKRGGVFFCAAAIIPRNRPVVRQLGNVYCLVALEWISNRFIGNPHTRGRS